MAVTFFLLGGTEISGTFTIDRDLDEIGLLDEWRERKIKMRRHRKKHVKQIIEVVFKSGIEMTVGGFLIFFKISLNLI